MAKRLTTEEVFDVGNSINSLLRNYGISYAMQDKGNNTWDISMYNQNIGPISVVFTGTLRECYTYLTGVSHLAQSLNKERI